MPKITQDNRILSITTPLGKDVLLINGFSMREELSRLFTIEVDLLHENEGENAAPKEVKGEEILGKSVTIEIEQPDKTKRYFNGIVNRFSQGNRDEQFTSFRMELVPQLWLLTQVSQSRIFQGKSVPDILKEVLGEVNFKPQLEANYKPRNYCVQYRETDFDFISRLMEEEGIYYFFEHEAKLHTMILADTASSHKDCPSKSEFEFVEDTKADSETVFLGAITDWITDFQLQTGKVAFWDHNFELPGNKLDVSLPSQFPVGNNKKLESYDYPGGYAGRFDGIAPSGGDRAADLQNIYPDKDRQAQVAIDALDSQYKTITGAGDCSSMMVGGRFSLVNHPMKSHNGQYVLTSIQHACKQSPDYRSESSAAQPYTNDFMCIPFGQGAPPFRPQRTTEKPTVQGAQTATVVGPSGEEIFTDKYGRVKVQFHWDRHGKNDEASSCWVNVAQGWAGNKWGIVFTPRIGQEAVVHFLEGDPDQPVITGCIYNPANMPPYELPKYKTKSTIKSNSTIGGGGFNEFRFEDEKGKEQIFVHGEKDQDIRIKADRKEIIGNDRHLTVENDKFEKVKGDSHIKVTGDKKEQVDGSVSLKVGSDTDIKTGMNYAHEAGMCIHLKAGMTCVVEAGMQLSLKVGGSFVDINPAGVFISGPMVMINSGGAAGSGAGSSPESPTDPKAPVTGDPGDKAAAPGKSPKPPDKPNHQTGPAATHSKVAKTGTPATSSSPPAGGPPERKTSTEAIKEMEENRQKNPGEAQSWKDDGDGKGTVKKGKDADPPAPPGGLPPGGGKGGGQGGGNAPAGSPSGGGQSAGGKGSGDGGQGQSGGKGSGTQGGGTTGG